MSESHVLKKIKLDAAKENIRLWRNNRGAAHTQNGFMRFGLGNESEQLDKIMKSSDLIGIRPITITQEMVGLTFGQFVSIETKHENWKFSGTHREFAQLNWINLIKSLGGYAKFSTGEL